jgi:hypothetical protein
MDDEEEGEIKKMFYLAEEGERAVDEIRNKFSISLLLL